MSGLWRFVVISISLVILVWLLWRSPPAELQALLGVDGQQAPSYPFAYASDIETIQYDQTGRMSYQLVAQQARYFVKEDQQKEAYALLTAPKFKTYVDNKVSWSVSAQRARHDEQRNLLALTENVVIEQIRPDGLLSLMETTFLQVNSQARFAETDKPVAIYEDTGVVKATGAKVFIDEQRTELLSNVRATYEPE